MALASVVLIGTTNARIDADVIRQTPGTDYLVAEAEDYDILDNLDDETGYIEVFVDDAIETEWGSLVLPPESNASGGVAMFDQAGGDPFGMESIINYKFRFDTPGDYSLYWHYSLYEMTGDDSYAGEDSVFVATDFNRQPEAIDPNYSVLGNRDAIPSDEVLEGNFFWQRATWDGGAFTPAEYTVTDADVGSVLDFAVGMRERGVTIDALVFHLDGNLIDEFGESDELDDLLAGQGANNGPPQLQPGDADQDLDFDQLDIVRISIANKFLTGLAATWGEGDWDGAPGGSPGNPPAGNGFFDQLDVIAALASGKYLTGPYAALQAAGVENDEQTTLVYDSTTGELKVDAPASTDLTSIFVTSASNSFLGDKPAVLDGPFDSFASDNIFKSTIGGSFGDMSFGNVMPVGLSESDILTDLSASGSLSGGGGLGEVDLIYIPEPSSFVIAWICLMGIAAARRRVFAG